MKQHETIDLKLWVEKHTRELYAWALHKVSDPELAKDLVQDTFLAAVEKGEKFKGTSNPKTWLFAILNHKIIDFYRKKTKNRVIAESGRYFDFFGEDGTWKTEKRPLAWDDTDQNLLDNSDFLVILNKCLDALPDIWHACIKLKYIMNKNGEEICQELGISATNFWQIVHRAKLQLRECVEIKWFKD
jgi:RNA polymerase sigma-70 factor (TIGR02943 family)